MKGGNLSERPTIDSKMKLKFIEQLDMLRNGEYIEELKISQYLGGYPINEQ
ncbi:hypothetical protein [Clostridium haemolyticum]|uniref:Uncharacterized protein n=1 Tax=Clostridium haemolyticum NCTC 9693 TaxID=1443114 RepID=A0ABR4TAY7_CLOHA|nr:hypothetical protein [Clostridium haemolyticum]KEI14100.1 hypothetical protein Z960_p0106 [Clostridium haemolyticum NCTC 9693]